MKNRISFSQVIGEVLLTVGVLLLLFAFYESYWTNLASAKMQDDVQTRLEEQWVCLLYTSDAADDCCRV